MTTTSKTNGTWIYVLGEVKGKDVKIGQTAKARVGERIKGVNKEQTTSDEYVLLAAMLGPAGAEEVCKKYFEEFRRAKGTRTEYFDPEPPLVGWILWLREQWWTSFDPMTTQDEWTERHPSDWVPNGWRRSKPPPRDESKLVQDYEQLQGPLAGTAWSWIPDPLASFQDFFTPPDIVSRAAIGMTGRRYIPLDLASHWIANRRFHEAGIEIGDYYHVNRSAFNEPWQADAAWLNPPYKNNAPWLERAEAAITSGELEQLCWLSPVHVFNTFMATPLVRSASVMILLSPTPKFYNPGDPLRTGTNLPHAIVYWGKRQEEIVRAFDGVGIPFQLL